MKKSSKIILLAITCCSLFAIGQTFAQGTPSSDPPKNEAIVLKSSKYNEIQWEQENYIRKHYEDYSTASITYSLPSDKDNRYLETYALVKEGDHRIEITFDLTNAYKARNRKGNEALKKIIEDLESEKSNRKSNRKSSQLTKEESKEIGEAVTKTLKEDIDRLTNEKETLTETEREIIAKKIEALVNKLKKEKLEDRKKSTK